MKTTLFISGTQALHPRCFIASSTVHVWVRYLLAFQEN